MRKIGVICDEDLGQSFIKTNLKLIYGWVDHITINLHPMVGRIGSALGHLEASRNHARFDTSRVQPLCKLTACVGTTSASITRMFEF